MSFRQRIFYRFLFIKFSWKYLLKFPLQFCLKFKKILQYLLKYITFIIVAKLLLLIFYYIRIQSTRSGISRWIHEGVENRQEERSLVIAQGAGGISGRTGITLTDYGNRRDPGQIRGPIGVNYFKTSGVINEPPLWISETYSRPGNAAFANECKMRRSGMVGATPRCNAR